MSNVNINLTSFEKGFEDFCKFYSENNIKEMREGALALNKKIKEIIRGDKFALNDQTIRVFEIQSKVIKKFVLLSKNDSSFGEILRKLILIRDEHLVKLTWHGLCYVDGKISLTDNVAALMKGEDVLNMLRLFRNAVSINLSNFTLLNAEDIHAIKTKFPHLLLIGSHEDRFSDFRLVIPAKKEIFYANSQMLEGLSKELIPTGDGKVKIGSLSGIPVDIIKEALTYPCCGKIKFDISSFENLLKCADFFGNKKLIDFIEDKLIKNLRKINIANFYFNLRFLADEYHLHELAKKLDLKLSSKFFAAKYDVKSIYNTQSAKDAFGLVKRLTIDAKEKWSPSMSQFNYLSLFAKSLKTVKFKNLKFFNKDLDPVLHWLRGNISQSIEHIIFNDYDPCILKILEAISSNRELQVKSLTFKGFNVDSKFLAELGKLPHLKELKIHGIWNAKLHELPKGLEKLDLSASEIESSVFRNYVWPSGLTVLNLSEIDIPENIANSMILPENCKMITDYN